MSVVSEVPRRVLVTGAAGRIGRAVLDLLAVRGIEATALVLEDPGDLAASRVVVGSAGDVKVVRSALPGVDAVIHLAARPAPTSGTPVEVFADNTRATFTVLESAGAAGVRRAVIASSYSANGLPWTREPVPPAYLPVDERLPSAVEDPYALSKQADELTAAMMARRHGLTVVAVRYPFVGGVDERLAAHARLLTDDPARGVRELWSYLDVRDAALAALSALAVDDGAAHVVLVAAPETLVPYPTSELLRRYLPDVPVRRPLPGRTVPIDTSAAARLFGFAARYPLPA
ncbi:NAD-dependent epimerase/dehydratase family protein [Jiangella aurantiaca]|uniref:NAD-dependent epimerase/dehydratase family protein n=1 Tax=Jiangella aurantiaca TaxID=2530373 RepID=UPI00193D8A90|nr:NAD(P)-dependent oxidoreductase [Jiangella aurantiaca]